MGELERECIKWDEWYDDDLNPCIQHRKCLESEDPKDRSFSTESILDPTGAEQMPVDKPSSTVVGFFIGGILGLVWIAYR